MQVKAGRLKCIVKGVTMTTLFLLYPYLVYKGIEKGVVWLAPSIFAGIFLYQAVLAKKVRIRLRKLLIASLLLAGSYYLQSVTAKVLPVLIQLMLLYFFARTLVKGPPFIESFVRLEFSHLPDEVVRYCRQLTWLWSGFFAFNALVCTGLAIWGPDAWWTLFNGVMIYVMIGLLTLGEYIYRHFRFPHLAIPDPKSTVKNMFVNGRKIWLDVQAR
jgi:uncharacterized membrane protein